MGDRRTEEKLQKSRDDFRGKMEKLGLGVSISVDGGPMVELVPPPECDGSRNCKAESHIEGCFKSERPRP